VSSKLCGVTETIDNEAICHVDVENAQKRFDNSGNVNWSNSFTIRIEENLRYDPDLDTDDQSVFKTREFVRSTVMEAHHDLYITTIRFEGLTVIVTINLGVYYSP
jgi:hypothetical protein